MKPFLTSTATFVTDFFLSITYDPPFNDFNMIPICSVKKQLKLKGDDSLRTLTPIGPSFCLFRPASIT